jgi:hemerythrin-like domain-containing protein
MNFTTSFTRQHNEIIEIVTEIDQNLDNQILMEKSEETASLLNLLAGKLTAHLTMEDKVLYPKSMSNPSLEIKKTTKEFMDEMGSLSSVFKSYVAKWQDSNDIKEKADDFIIETKNLFQALGQRVEKENNILYPLADK